VKNVNMVIDSVEYIMSADSSPLVFDMEAIIEINLFFLYLASQSVSFDCRTNKLVLLLVEILIKYN